MAGSREEREDGEREREPGRDVHERRGEAGGGGYYKEKGEKSGDILAEREREGERNACVYRQERYS